MKMNEMYLTLGDPSNDGHGHYDAILCVTNKTLKEIRTAYKASCKLTKISFNHNEDYTGEKRGYKLDSEYRICTDYQVSKLTETVLDVLEEFNCPYIKEFKREPYLCNDDFCVLWWWFVGLSLPGLEWEQKTVKDNIPIINDGDLNVQFGYGLYDA